jgi:hypothetical protein
MNPIKLKSIPILAIPRPTTVIPRNTPTVDNKATSIISSETYLFAPIDNMPNINENAQKRINLILGGTYGNANIIKKGIISNGIKNFIAIE